MVRPRFSGAAEGRLAGRWKAVGTDRVSSSTNMTLFDFFQRISNGNNMMLLHVKNWNIERRKLIFCGRK